MVGITLGCLTLMKRCLNGAGRKRFLPNTPVNIIPAMNASKIAIGGNTGISPPHPTESDVSPPPTGEPISNILAYQ